MESIWEIADDALFGSPLAEDALFSPTGGEAKAIRVTVRNPDDLGSDLLSSGLYSDGVVLDFRVSDVAVPKAGDQVTVLGETFSLVGEPRQHGGVWRVSAR